jgi:hypothetical protein
VAEVAVVAAFRKAAAAVAEDTEIVINSIYFHTIFKIPLMRDFLLKEFVLQVNKSKSPCFFR